MLIKRSAEALTIVAVALTVASGAVAQARSGERHRRQPVVDVDVTSSVTLGMLSVRPLAADKPWDPGVCIGCDRNNASPSARAVRGDVRVR